MLIIKKYHESCTNPFFNPISKTCSQHRYEILKIGSAAVIIIIKNQKMTEEKKHETLKSIGIGIIIAFTIAGLLWTAVWLGTPKDSTEVLTTPEITLTFKEKCMKYAALDFNVSEPDCFFSMQPKCKCFESISYNPCTNWTTTPNTKTCIERLYSDEEQVNKYWNRVQFQLVEE